MSQTVLRQHHDVWKRKPLLRALYNDWYAEMCRWLIPGRTLEIGGGSGNLKEAVPQVITTDVVCLPWLDAVVNAQYLPFRSGSFDNIILFDVLHHLENPVLFLNEARRVLIPGGRLIMMEPYVSWMSYPVYRFLHPEPLDLSVDPFLIVAHDVKREPFHANQGIPTLLLERYWERFGKVFPGFQELGRQRLGFIAYPLSGGFDRPTMMPMWLYRPISWVEKYLSPLGKLLAFRFIVTLEKK